MEAALPRRAGDPVLALGMALVRRARASGRARRETRSGTPALRRPRSAQSASAATCSRRVASACVQGGGVAGATGPAAAEAARAASRRRARAAPDRNDDTTPHRRGNLSDSLESSASLRAMRLLRCDCVVSRRAGARSRRPVAADPRLAGVARGGGVEPSSDIVEDKDDTILESRIATDSARPRRADESAAQALWSPGHGTVVRCRRSTSCRTALARPLSLNVPEMSSTIHGEERRANRKSSRSRSATKWIRR